MLESLENLDLPQCSHRHPFLLVVHQDTFESDVLSGFLVDSFMDLSA